MGNLITLDEPMGPGFLIFFKKVKRSNDLINIRPPEWLYRTIDCDDAGPFEIKEVEKVHEKVEKLRKKGEDVKKAVDVLLESKYTPSEVRDLVKIRDLAEEVEHPRLDTECALTVVLQWFLTVQIWHDDEEAILALLLF